MGLFDFFKKKKTPKQKDDIFYQLPERFNLIEVAKILTNNAHQVVEDFSLLVSDPQAFSEKHHEWCNRYYGPEDIKNLTAFWLIGFETPFIYGGFTDLIDNTEANLWLLNQAIEQLGYPITIDEIEFIKEESIEEALEKICAHLLKQAYTLVTLDIGGDFYPLFIVPTEDYSQLRELGKTIRMDFLKVIKILNCTSSNK